MIKKHPDSSLEHNHTKWEFQHVLIKLCRPTVCIRAAVWGVQTFYLSHLPFPFAPSPTLQMTTEPTRHA